MLLNPQYFRVLYRSVSSGVLLDMNDRRRPQRIILIWVVPPWGSTTLKTLAPCTTTQSNIICTDKTIISTLCTFMQTSSFCLFFTQKLSKMDKQYAKNKTEIAYVIYNYTLIYGIRVHTLNF